MAKKSMVQTAEAQAAVTTAPVAVAAPTPAPAGNIMTPERRSKALELLQKHAAPVVLAAPREISQSAPYVGFFHPNSPEAVSVRTAFPDIKEPDTYIKYADGRMERLRTYRFIAINGWRYWGHYDKTGAMLAASLNEPAPKSPLENKEQIIIPMFVFRDDGKLVGAISTFRTTKCNAGTAALNTIALAASDAWFGYSPAHRATQRIQYPAMRFATTVTCTRGVSRTSGNEYYAAKGNPQPLSAVDMDALSEFLSSDDGLRQFEKIMAGFETLREMKIKDIEKLNAVKPTF